MIIAFRSLGVLYALAAVLALIPKSARSDESGFYAGVGLGYARYPENAHLNVNSVVLEGSPEDREDTAWSATIGYRINRHFALEAGYVDLGEVRVDMTDLSGATNSAGVTSFGVEGATLAVVGTWPLGNWDLHVRAGALFAETRLAFAGSVEDSPVDAAIRGEAFDGFVGVGVGYAISDRWHVALDLTHFSNAGEEHSGQADVAGLDARVVYRF